MDQVARRGVEFTGSRASKREKIFEPATLLYGGDARRAHLLDISMTGALAHADYPPDIGSNVLIRCAQQDLHGSVVWVDGKRFGLSFDPALEAEAVERVYRHATGR